MIEKIKKQIVQAYSGLTFKEGVHLYFFNNKRIPKSVSGKVKEVVPPFNAEFWAKWCRDRQKEEYIGLTEHQIIHKWQTINEEACRLGTVTHTFLENFTGHQNPTSPQEAAGIKFLVWLMSQTYEYGGRTRKKYTIVCKELRGFSKIYNYAGTLDLLVYDNETDELIIFDYKTNKDLFRRFGYMLAPFDELENHPYNHYQIQLSFYRVFLEEIGLKIAGQKIVYLQADGEYAIIDLDDYTVEVIDYLKTQNKPLYAAW